MSDLRARRKEIEAAGVGIVLVHLASEPEATEFLGAHGLADLPRISDPEKRLYGALNLPRGTLRTLFGPRVWLRGFLAGAPRWLGGAGLGVGRPQGDPLQMPGTFVIHRGRIVREHCHRDVADRPDYCTLARGACAGSQDTR